ncbi:MAG: nitroreductase family protein [Bacteroidales bacterium]
MNKTIENQLTRRSIRMFNGRTVKKEDLELIVKAGQHAPTSIGAQQISLVIVDDKKKIAKIAEYTGGQPQVAGADKFICIVIDFNRTNVACEAAGKEQIVQNTAEGLLVGAVDAGIMLSALETAAHSLGYGCTAIGGIRYNPKRMVELLGLPKNTFPVVGLTIGCIDEDNKPEIKPRVETDTFAFYNEYDSQKVTKGVVEYDTELRKWWDAQGMKDMKGYIDMVSSTYSQKYYPHVKSVLEEQGFGFE